MTTVIAIQNHVAASFGIAMRGMRSKRRQQRIARPRMVAMYLARHLTKLSFPDIGRRFGNRHHATVMHAVRRITDLMAENEAFRDRVTELSDQLQQAPDAL